MQLSAEVLSKMDFTKNRIVFDWFSFSSRADSFDTFKTLLGMEHCSWQELPGVRSYSCRYYFDGISIHYAGNNSVRFPGTDSEQVVKGAWLEMSGSGCRAFEHFGHGNWQVLFDYVRDHQEMISFSRFDIAYDDFIGLLDLDKIVDDTFSGNFVSRFRRSDVQCCIDRVSNDKAYTVTHGSLKSDVFIRIYDKRLEQNCQDICSHWVRNELQLRHNSALNAVLLLCDEFQDHGAARLKVRDSDCVDNIYFCIMNNYLRYIEPSETDSNRWRAPMAAHWSKFADSITTLRVSVWSCPPSDFTPIKLDNYVVDMAGGAIFTWLSIFGVDKFLEVIRKKGVNLNPKYQELLLNYTDSDSFYIGEWDEKFFDQYIDTLTE